MTIRGLIVSIVMTIVLCIMTLGYAALQQRIDIQGEATVDSTYRVEITSVAEGTSVGDARSTNAPQYNALTANFYVGLTNDTDYITYTVEITNYSTVDIRLNNTEITSTNSSMKTTKSGIRNGDIMLAGSTKTVTIKVKLDTEANSEQIGTITLTFDFTRLKGGTGEVINEEGLPNGYKTCEYITIQNDSTNGYSNSINTGIKFSYANKIEFTYKSTDSKSSIMFVAAYQTRPDQQPYIAINSNSAQFIRGFDSVSTIPSSLSRASASDGSIRNITANYSSTSNYYISFGSWIDSVWSRSIDWYSFKIYNNDDMIRDLIPALDNNGEPCFYDMVSGDTLYNSGTGNFLYQLKQ